MGRKHIKDHSQAYSGTLPSGEIKKLRAAVDHLLSGRCPPTASISDFRFLFSVSRFLISDICLLFSDFCFLFSVFWRPFSDICFLIPVFCFLISDICSLMSVFLSHTPLGKEKTAHLINKICCPYCQAFSGLRIDSSAFSFSGFRQPLSVFIRQTDHSALRTWWDACR